METYLITGSTGFIGGAVFDELAQDPNAHFVLPVRNLDKAQKLHGVKASARYIVKDLESLKAGDIPENIDYIIHCAATTASKEMITHPVEVADGILFGTRNILNIARTKNIKSMVFLSSMEAYGVVDDDGTKRSENETGTIDLTSTRSCYPLGKQMAELYCLLYAEEFGTPVKIARLSQVFGSRVLQSDNRAYMQFARAAVNGDNIVLNTPGLSIGNYCATEDVVSAILIILRKGANGETYNVANEKNTMRIRDMAQLVADEIAGGAIGVRFNLENNTRTGYAADTGLRMSSEKLRALGWQPTKSVPDMYKDIIASFGGIQH